MNWRRLGDDGTRLVCSSYIQVQPTHCTDCQPNKLTKMTLNVIECLLKPLDDRFRHQALYESGYRQRTLGYLVEFSAFTFFVFIKEHFCKNVEAVK